MSWLKKVLSPKNVRRAIGALVFTIDNRDEFLSLFNEAGRLRADLRAGKLDMPAAIARVDALYDRFDRLRDALKINL